MSKFRRFLAAKLLTEDHPNDIMMTMDSNPEVMRICYRNGFAKNKAYMTYLEASAVTDTSKFNSAFNNSDIVYFNEAKYFTGITGTISFTAPKLLEFALPPNISCNINGRFQKCYKYDIGVCVSLSLRNGIETFLNPSISDIVADPNNKNWGVVEGHLGKGKILYQKSSNNVGWAVPMYPGDVIIYPKKHQPNQIISVSFTHAMFGGHTIVANNFYSGNASFWNGGYYVQKIIAFKSTSYYNYSSFPSNIGSKVPQSVVKEFIVSADDPKDFMTDTNYTTNFLNPNVCNFQLRRVNFGITIYNEKALFPLKGLYADEYFMTKEECAEVTTLGDRFNNSDVEEFTELQYFTSLENIDNAFYGCSKLKKITLPSHITTIGNNAFANCTSLESIIIPEGVTSIGNNAFANCTSLESIVIPEGVTFIGNNAFANCTSLESIVIPSTVTYIGDNAFSGCVNISRITMNPTTAPTLGENVWGDNESNYVGGNVSYYKYVGIKDEYIGYDTDKWNVLIDLGFNKIGYVYIEYIESNSEAWIDTGVLVNDDSYIFEGEFMADKFVSGGTIFSNYYALGIPYVFFATYQSNSFHYNYRSTNNVVSYPTTGERIKFIANNKTLTLNSNKANVTTNTLSKETDEPLVLFNRGPRAIKHLDIGLKIYSFKIFKSGKVLRDFVPVRIDNIGYMFDTVSGQLFGNSGTGEFTLGPDI